MAKKTFRSSVGGYKREEVNSFIAELSRTYKKSQEENKALIESQNGEIDRLTAQVELMQSATPVTENSTDINEQLDCCNKQLGEAVDMIDQCQSQLVEKECELTTLKALCEKQQSIIQEQAEQILAFEESGDSKATETTALDIACRAAAIAVQNMEEKHLQTNAIIRQNLGELAETLDENHQSMREQIIAIMDEFAVE